MNAPFAQARSASPSFQSRAPSRRAIARCLIVATLVAPAALACSGASDDVDAVQVADAPAGPSHVDAFDPLAALDSGPSPGREVSVPDPLPSPESLELEHVASVTRRDPVALHASLAGLCAAFIRDVHAARKAPGYRARLRLSDGEQLGAPSCERVGDVPFASQAPASAFRRAHAVRFDDGYQADTRVVLETARGFAATPAGWDERDPGDPGCPSIKRPAPPEPLRVEAGHVIIERMATTVYYLGTGVDDEAPKATIFATRWLTICGERDGVLACTEVEPMGDALGVKRATEGEALDLVPWSAAPRVVVDEEGALRLVADKR